MRPYLVLSAPRAGVSNVNEATTPGSMRSFDRGSLLCLSIDTDVIHVTKWTRPSPPSLHTASDQKLDGALPTVQFTTVQFLIACSMHKRRGKAWPVNDVSVYQGRRQRGGEFPIDRTSLRPYLVVASPNDIHNSEKLRNRFWSGSAVVVKFWSPREIGHPR